MNNLHRPHLTCALLSLVLGVFAVPALASDNSQVIRSAQMRLADLGFYVGRYDGVLGPVTKAAISDFQRQNEIPASGQLSQETYTLLTHNDYAMWHRGYFADNRDTYGRRIDAFPVSWVQRWGAERSESLPSRYGKLDVTENDRGSLRHYTVTFNGTPVMIAQNQPYILRVSKTFALDREDAVIITAYQNDGACAYKNYLLTIHSDGSFKNPTEVGNCSSRYDAHIADHGLLVSFPTVNPVNGLSTWDVWHYENNKLVHI